MSSERAPRFDESPCRPPDQAQEAEAQGGEAWALPFDVPPVDIDWKLVSRVMGTGDLRVNAVDPERRSHLPTDGPRAHESSNFDRPGDEWGTFRFEEDGC